MQTPRSLKIKTQHEIDATKVLKFYPQTALNYIFFDVLQAFGVLLERAETHVSRL
jgi:hypothetical protein